jgi:hypothetical protein
LTFLASAYLGNDEKIISEMVVLMRPTLLNHSGEMMKVMAGRESCNFMWALSNNGGHGMPHKFLE